MRLAQSKYNKLSRKSGIGLIEVLIGATIITVGVLSISGAYTAFLNLALSNDKNVQAAYLVEEAFETVSFFRDESWANNIAGMNVASPHYISWNGTRWATSTSPEYVAGKFLREIRYENVYRDATGAVVPSGTLDPDTRKVSVTISYFQGHATTTRTVASYIANIRN